MTVPPRAFGRELAAIAREAKAGTEHEAHDGWSWQFPDRAVRCSCGATLVEAVTRPSGPR